MLARSSWAADFIGEYENQFTRMKRERRRDTSSFLYVSKQLLVEAKENGGISITDSPCKCSCNHYAISIGDKQICPVRFWLGAAALMEPDVIAKMFIERHPFSQIVRRVDAEHDGTYRPELDRKETNEDTLESPVTGGDSVSGNPNQ